MTFSGGKISHMVRLNTVTGDWFGQHFENAIMTLGDHLFGNKEQHQEGEPPALQLCRCLCYGMVPPMRKAAKSPGALAECKENISLPSPPHLSLAH